MNNMFKDCVSLESVNFNNFKTNKIKYMSYMFYGCANIISIDLGSFQTSELIFLSNFPTASINLYCPLPSHKEPINKIFSLLLKIFYIICLMLFIINAVSDQWFTMIGMKGVLI